MIHQYCQKRHAKPHDFIFTWQGLDRRWHGYQNKDCLWHQNKIKYSWIILVCRLQTISDILLPGSCSWIKDIALCQGQALQHFSGQNFQPPKLLSCWILDCLKSKPNMPNASLTLCIAQQQFCCQISLLMKPMIVVFYYCITKGMKTHLTMLLMNCKLISHALSYLHCNLCSKNLCCMSAIM